MGGTDYFVGGVAALVTGPIMYFIFKRKYGGLTKNDPEYYTETYGIEGLFGILISCIRWMTAALGMLTVILVIIASRVRTQRRGG